jgi:hypothetical protein
MPDSGVLHGSVECSLPCHHPQLSDWKNQVQLASSHCSGVVQLEAGTLIAPLDLLSSVSNREPPESPGCIERIARTEQGRIVVRTHWLPLHDAEFPQNWVRGLHRSLPYYYLAGAQGCWRALCMRNSAALLPGSQSSASELGPWCSSADSAHAGERQYCCPSHPASERWLLLAGSHPRQLSYPTRTDTAGAACPPVCH